MVTDVRFWLPPVHRLPSRLPLSPRYTPPFHMPSGHPPAPCLLYRSPGLRSPGLRSPGLQSPGLRFPGLPPLNPLPRSLPPQ
ncbi:hypothetical protein BC936DRAFT_140831 [Jimgerdemannia flammicorona]|uniref:Uncharacterized protein n=1 Tax=Jimgerdemannia flammicorona TaxID=994334 RepID=A0A433DGL1_9FUNG|nr:hypothetical protein BC936DRAFT_140831 [Jimgerdemannia flammicorona]